MSTPAISLTWRLLVYAGIVLVDFVVIFFCTPPFGWPMIARRWRRR